MMSGGKHRHHRLSVPSNNVASSCWNAPTVAVVAAALLVWFLAVSLLPLPRSPLREIERSAGPFNLSLTHTDFYVQPYFVRAHSSEPMEEDDVCIVAQVSIDRLERVLHMADEWRGPMSVAVYVHDHDDAASVAALATASSHVASLVDFHLLYHNNTRYPVNSLRNLAIEHARCPFTLVLDIDFRCNQHMRQQLRHLVREYILEQRSSLDNDDDASYPASVFVVPAFQTLGYPPPAAHTLPNTKEDLKTAIEYGLVAPINMDRCSKCHKPVEYRRWFSTSQPYIVQYRWIFEPFLLFRKNDRRFPRFNELFKGYGFDKNSHALHVAYAGFTFIVAPESFVIHIEHPIATWGGASISSQLWEALQVLCPYISELALRYHKTSPQYGEPFGQECYTNSHW